MAGQSWDVAEHRLATRRPGDPANVSYRKQFHLPPTKALK